MIIGHNQVVLKDKNHGNGNKEVETMINNRPVRKFNYKTPNEVHLLKTKVVALIA